MFHLCVMLGVLTSSVGIIVTFTNPWTDLFIRLQWDLVIVALSVLASSVAIVTYGWGRWRQHISKEEVV